MFHKINHLNQKILFANIKKMRIFAANYRAQRPNEAKWAGRQTFLKSAYLSALS